MRLGPVTDLVTELVGLVDAYHRALDGPVGPAAAEELAIRHGRVQVAMRTATDFTGLEPEPAAVAA